MRETENSLGRDFLTITSFDVTVMLPGETVQKLKNEIKRIYSGTFIQKLFIHRPLCDYVMILILQSDFHYHINDEEK